MRSRRPALATLVACAALAACGPQETPSKPLFAGAQPFRLASAERGETPTLAELEELVRATVAVAGGAERLRTLAWRRTDDVWLTISGDPLASNAVGTVCTRGDLSVRTQLRYRSGQDEQRVMLRGIEWLKPRDGALVRASGVSRHYVQWDWQLARLPVILLDAQALEGLPPRREEGRLLIGMRVDVPDLFPKFEAWIDPAGPCVAELHAKLPMTGDLAVRAEIDQVLRLADWRRVGDVLLPFRRDVVVAGRRQVLVETRDYELDPTLADSEFLPDGGPAEPPR